MLAALACTVSALHQPAMPRRAVLAGAAAALSQPIQVHAEQIIAPGFEASRVQGIGGGADMLSDDPPSVFDSIFPPSMNGTWQCQRIVTSIEGDEGQAMGAWKLLGGYGDIRSPESYAVRFMPQPEELRQPMTGLDGKTYFGVVLDRGFELDQRVHGASVQWDPRTPSALEYSRNEGGRGSSAALRVMRRSIEGPDEKGWGSDELYRITTTTSLLGDITYAARVKRRYRRALTDSGERLVEGLEIMKTFRVLDGIAGVEFPTSTTKSVIKLTRK